MEHLTPAPSDFIAKWLINSPREKVLEKDPQEFAYMINGTYWGWITPHQMKVWIKTGKFELSEEQAIKLIRFVKESDELDRSLQ